ncbi:glycosyltransferase family 2 protein [Roseibium sp. MMSF_3412]|uniref:glycosyltransferase family 2 protein n=1 Tax=Roseibium sp. MMSF_3412 TaxID=3046712 RepID=UPI00273D6ADB|nr:glycosyltransferase family 2 protein [Roseibium sp. MMSF_3412]
MTDTYPTLEIIIVSYNTADLTLDALRSVYETTKVANFEVTVFDNDSSDDSANLIAQQFPQAKLIRSKDNIGFAAANNEAIKTTNSEWVLLLNPDTVCFDGAIDNLMSFALSRPDAGIFGGRTEFKDGSLNPTSCWRFMSPWSLFTGATGLARLFPKSDLINREEYGKWQRDRVREVEIVTGCFFLTTRKLWDQLEGFDTDFFMYAEEADLCYRANKQGVRALFTPDASIVHYGGASEPVRSDKMVRLLRAKMRFIRKHWSDGQVALGVLLFKLHVNVRRSAYFVLSRTGNKASHRDSLDVWTSIAKRQNEWISGE